MVRFIKNRWDAVTNLSHSQAPSRRHQTDFNKVDHMIESFSAQHSSVHYVTDLTTSINTLSLLNSIEHAPILICVNWRCYYEIECFSAGVWTNIG